ncbi:MAG TPA: hypothetical protein VIW23_09350 [Candidatus Acidoferrum sp.]|jgi:hypothetical protein
MPPENSFSGSRAFAQITVTRDSLDDVQTRQIIVSLDGVRQAELLFGDAITIPVSPGPHILRVDNTWNRKDLHVDVDSGADLRFVTKSSAGQFSRFLLVAFGAGPIYVSIEPASPSAP